MVTSTLEPHCKCCNLLSRLQQARVFVTSPVNRTMPRISEHQRLLAELRSQMWKCQRKTGKQAYSHVQYVC